jgi:hypothetical protein
MTSLSSSVREMGERFLMIQPNHTVLIGSVFEDDRDEFIALVMPNKELDLTLKALNRLKYNQWMRECATAHMLKQPHPRLESIDNLPIELVRKDGRTCIARTEQEAVLASAALADALTYLPTA